jgi:nucleotide-binding universal stress UspA family protein
MSPLKVLLVPTDFSELADRALEVARGLAEVHRARIVLLNVQYVGGEGAFVYTGNERDRLLDAARSELQRRVQSLRDGGIITDLRLAEGLPDREILESANAVGADLIVMGTHGRTGLGRLFLGSIAQAVVARSQRPVLLVPAPSERRAVLTTGSQS